MDETLSLLKTLRAKHPEIMTQQDYDYVSHVADRFGEPLETYEARIKDNPRKYGPVHGDCNFKNHIHHEGSGKTTLFDTDLTKMGPYIYDLAVMEWSRILAPDHVEFPLSPVVEYRRQTNLLEPSDIEMMEAYVVLRQLRMIKQRLESIQKHGVNDSSEVQVDELRKIERYYNPSSGC